LEHGFHVIALEPVEAAWQTVPASQQLTKAQSARDLAPCELIIESISENFPAKRSLFEELEEHVGPSVPIGSNTSSIPITLLQAGRKYPRRFAGMHWTTPAQTTRFMEIIRGDQTDDATIESIAALARELDKEPGIVQKDIAGFVANRIAYAMYREALHLLEEGVADAETIDLLCRNSMGLWAPVCGPFRWIDITGGPALYATAMERITPTLYSDLKISETMRRMQQKDDRGSRNGRGFYTYAEGDDAMWQKKLHEYAMRAWEWGKEEV
jgi:3-hydroxybutyryl-CoA dehydrogenase